LAAKPRSPHHASDIVDYYHAHFRADQLTLVVAGDVDSALAQAGCCEGIL